MFDSFETILDSTLFRTLALEPTITKQDAVERVHQVLRDSGLSNIDSASMLELLRGVAQGYDRFGVINPFWLEKAGLRPSFFLVNAEPGWLEQLVADSESQREGISRYIVYGDYDSLIIFEGRAEEAQNLLATMTSSKHHEVVHFSSRSIPLIYGYEPVDLKSVADEINPDLVNRVALEYDSPELRDEREKLIKSGIILGPVWRSNIARQSHLTAFVGIMLRGRFRVLPKEVLRAFKSDPVLSTCLVHLFEADYAQPFDYFAKLTCRTMSELDRATNVIGSTRIGPVHCEGATLVVARGTDQLPIFRSQVVSPLNLAPRLDDVEVVARQLIVQLGLEAIEQFNRLPAAHKLVVLRSFDELNQQLTRQQWDGNLDKSLKAAIAEFSRSGLRTDGSVRGAVMEMTTCVEDLLRHTFQRIVQATHMDPKQVQKELGLPTRDLRRLTLNQTVTGLRNIRSHAVGKGKLEQTLGLERLERLERFASERNVWAHSQSPGGFVGERKVEEAGRLLVEGIEIVRWLSETVIPQFDDGARELGGGGTGRTPALELPESRGDRGFGVFISHSGRDAEVAERIASGLKAFDFMVWYSEWSIAPGDSIVQKISEALAKHDTLLLLLSPDSVKSEWVKRELNATLMAQLSGQRVRVLPIVIKSTEIPFVLKDIRYIDMSKEFQKGFLQLLEELMRLRSSAPSGGSVQLQGQEEQSVSQDRVSP